MRHSFTLLELLLVLTIAAMVLGTIGIGIPKVLHSEDFDKSVQGVISKLECATAVMLTYDTDVILTFKPTPQGVMCHLNASKPIPEAIMRSVNREALLPGVERVTFEGRDAKLLFQSLNSSISEGNLWVVGKKRVEIALPGFPKHIVKGHHEKIQIQAPYPQEALPSA